MKYANLIADIETTRQNKDELYKLAAQKYSSTMAEQLKVILIVPFITVFLTFTYTQFIKQPLYESSAIVLLPENKAGKITGTVLIKTIRVCTAYPSGDIYPILDISRNNRLPRLFK